MQTRSALFDDVATDSTDTTNSIFGITRIFTAIFQKRHFVLSRNRGILGWTPGGSYHNLWTWHFEPRIALRWELRGWGKRTWHFYLIHVYTDQKATSTVKQGYFTYTTLGGYRAVPGGNLRPSTGYWGKFPYKAGKCKHWCSSPSNTSKTGPVHKHIYMWRYYTSE